MENLKNRIDKIVKSNGCNYEPFDLSIVKEGIRCALYDANITLNAKGMIMKYHLQQKIDKQIARLNIPYMPFGHAIISEVRSYLSANHIESSNAYSK